MHNCNKTVGKLGGTAHKLCCQASRYDWSRYITHVHNIVKTVSPLSGLTR